MRMAGSSSPSGQLPAASDCNSDSELFSMMSCVATACNCCEAVNWSRDSSTASSSLFAFALLAFGCLGAVCKGSGCFGSVCRTPASTSGQSTRNRKENTVPFGVNLNGKPCITWGCPGADQQCSAWTLVQECVHSQMGWQAQCNHAGLTNPAP